jgi:O-antigen/teichoic acid export membrane protein
MSDPSTATLESPPPESARNSTRRMLRHSSVYAFGSIIKNIVSFIMLPLYTRYLSPADYGVISLMVLMLSLFELLFGARLGYALPKMFAESRSEQDKKTLISTALLFMIVVGALSSTAVFFTRSTLSTLIFGSTGYTVIVAYFSFMVLTQSVETHGLDYIRLQQRPWLFLVANILKLVMQLSLNIWFIVGLHKGVVGVAASTMISSATMAVLLLLYTVVKTGIRYDHKSALRMLAFSWPMWLAGLAGLYIGSSNRYYMRIFSGIDSTGLYSLAERFSGIMTMLIWQPFAQYWMVESFKFHQQGNRAAFRVVFAILGAILFIAALGISLFASPVIHVMSSRPFYPATQAVPFLVLSAIFSCMSGFVSFSFLVAEKTKQLGAYSYLTAVIVTVLYVALIPVLGHVGAAMASAMAQGIQLTIAYRQGRRLYDMDLSMSFLFHVGAVAAVAYLVATFVTTDLGFFQDLTVRVIAWTGATLLILHKLLHEKNIRQHAVEVAPGPLRPLLRYLVAERT